MRRRLEAWQIIKLPCVLASKHLRIYKIFPIIRANTYPIGPPIGIGEKVPISAASAGTCFLVTLVFLTMLFAIVGILAVPLIFASSLPIL